jgi:phosphoribosylanthranilate isomerase
VIAVKICGVCSARDAALVRAAGATHIGVIVGAPGPRRREFAEATRIYAAAGPLARVGVFADAARDTVCDLAGRLELDVVQLHGSESLDEVAAIAGAGPWDVWKAIRPLDAVQLEVAIEAWRGEVAALLVDGAAPGALGGTGVRAPWPALATVRARWPLGLSFVLAGGLTPENVAEAVRGIAPDIVDVSSGVEAAVGRKDAERVHAFVVAARAAGRPAQAQGSE